jgi:molybdate transport repressor ModE-like protein
MIDARRLAILGEVARHGSFNRAAAQLRLTPSAVSQQIAALEREVRAPVVARSTRGVRLTEAGRVLVEAAESIAGELAQAALELERLATARACLTIATFTSGGQRLLPSALRHFAADRPGIELTVIENEPGQSLPLVRGGAADLALAYHVDGPPPVRDDDRGLVWTPLLEDPMSVVVPADHRLAGRPSVRIADLADERWVHGCLSMGDTLDRYAAVAGYVPLVACRGTDYVFAQSLVKAAVGIALIPAVALVPDRAGLAVVELEPPRPTRWIGVVTARRRRPNLLADALLRSLTETVKSLKLAA